MVVPGLSVPVFPPFGVFWLLSLLPSALCSPEGSPAVPILKCKDVVTNVACFEEKLHP